MNSRQLNSLSIGPNKSLNSLLVNSAYPLALINQHTAKAQANHENKIELQQVLQHRQLTSKSKQVKLKGTGLYLQIGAILTGHQKRLLSRHSNNKDLSGMQDKLRDTLNSHVSCIV